MSHILHQLFKLIICWLDRLPLPIENFATSGFSKFLHLSTEVVAKLDLYDIHISLAITLDCVISVGLITITKQEAVGILQFP